MGFLIVFDANDEDSLKEAFHIHELLEEDMNKKKIKIRPIVYFVGNKIDKEPANPDSKMTTIIESARAYCDQNSMKFHETSALEFKKVKKLFREMISDIYN